MRNPQRTPLVFAGAELQVAGRLGANPEMPELLVQVNSLDWQPGEEGSGCLLPRPVTSGRLAPPWGRWAGPGVRGAHWAWGEAPWRALGPALSLAAANGCGARAGHRWRRRWPGG